MAPARNPPATTPDYERLLELAYTLVLSPESWAIDVGAHHGRHTLPLALAVGPQGYVLAFEPLPQARRVLQGRLATERTKEPRLAPVEIRGEALGLIEGSASFVAVKEYPEFSGLRNRIYDVDVQTYEIEVEVRCLDSFLPRLEPIAFLKIDAEGGETHILQGAVNLLRRDRPIVGFEFGDNSNLHYGVTSHDLFDLFEETDYHLFSILGEPLDRNRFAQSSAAQQLWDYIAVPEEKSKEIGRDLIQLLSSPG